jgi:hypothetical protein
MPGLHSSMDGAGRFSRCRSNRRLMGASARRRPTSRAPCRRHRRTWRNRCGTRRGLRVRRPAGAPGGWRRLLLPGLALPRYKAAARGRPADDRPAAVQGEEPSDLAFLLTPEESGNLRYQIGTSSLDGGHRGTSLRREKFHPSRLRHPLRRIVLTLAPDPGRQTMTPATPW